MNQSVTFAQTHYFQIVVISLLVLIAVATASSAWTERGVTLTIARDQNVPQSNSIYMSPDSYVPVEVKRD